ncbi:MAG: class I SAM-dependent methyltransferase [Janthinobacterium lividum]
MPLPPTLHRNDYGFYEVSHKPSPEELRDYYARRYYQESHATYQAHYPPEEVEYLTGRLRLRRWALEQLLAPEAPRRFLDVGCGEGWALAHFQEAGWEVLGLDFSSYSLEQFHPGLRGQLRTGDLYEQLGALAAEGQQFGALWLDNVLEHVLDPAELLRRCRAVLAPGSVALVEVPNDFSPLQEHLLATGHIEQPFWVVLPDHLSYFNPSGLQALAEATGWHLARTLADHPIDLSLLTPATNYVRDRTAGPAAHRARVAQENLLLRTASLPAVAAYYEGMAGVGLGRNIVAFLQPQ